jgi:Mn-dependent DtxR family transcriptional regulator
MSNEAFDKFLLKLFEKRAALDESSYYNTYAIGKEIGIFDETEINRIVRILQSDGFVTKDADAKIRITEKGKKRLENNQI